MPLEEVFVDGHVLDRHEPAARLMLLDGIDERRRKPKADSVQQGRNVEHGGIAD
jgi:hypothetical protein